MTEKLTELTERFDAIVLDVLGPIRMSKRVDSASMAELLRVLDELATTLADAPSVPRKLVGDLWFIFTSMLAEAGHAKDPQPILAAAWEVQEKLARIFGPF